MRGCVWPKTGLGLGPQPGALSLLCHLISPVLHKGGVGHKGPIWPAIKSVRAPHAVLWEHLRACCTRIRDFEDAENRTSKKK